MKKEPKWYGVFKNTNTKEPNTIMVALNDTTKRVFGEPIFVGTKEDCKTKRDSLNKDKNFKNEEE